MASTTAWSGNAKCTMSANLHSVTRNGSTVTVKISWSVAGYGQWVQGWVGGSSIGSATGSKEYWANLETSGTKTFTYTNQYAARSFSFTIEAGVNDGYAGKKYASTTVTTSVSAQDFTITFNANGGSTPTGSKSVTYGSTFGELPEPTRTGYTFLGWFTSSDGGDQITEENTVNITVDTTLYAHWKVKTVFRKVQNGRMTLYTLAFVKENDRTKQAISLFVVENGQAKQCI